jgi:hypothetical protein
MKLQQAGQKCMWRAPQFFSAIYYDDGNNDEMGEACSTYAE